MGEEPHAATEKQNFEYTEDGKYLLLLILVWFFGFVANIVVLWMWSFESSYTATVYLFKALAVADILYALFLFPYRFTKHIRGFLNLFFGILTIGNHHSGLYISLTLAVVRSIVTFRRRSAPRLLSRSRMKALIACIIVYALGLEGYNDGMYILSHTKADHVWVTLTKDWLAFLAPAILQVLLMAVVLLKVWHESVKNPVFGENLRSDSDLKAARKARQMAFVVTGICVASFIAYVVMHFLLVHFIPYSKNDERRHQLNDYIITLFGLINSGVPMCFYLCLRSFRFSLVRRIKRVAVSFTTSPLSTSSTYQSPPADNCSNSEATT